MTGDAREPVAGRAGGAAGGAQPGALAFLGLGLASGACLAVGVVLGHLLDAAAGTTPLCTLLGLAAGILFAVLGSFSRIRRYLRDQPTS